MPSILRSVLLVAVAVLCVVSHAPAQPGEWVTMPSTKDGRTADSPRDPLADGPHVEWGPRAGKGLMVSIGYYCDGKDGPGLTLIEGVDTLRFRGFCNDFGREYVLTAERPQSPPSRITAAERIMAVSDVHGEYNALCDFLKHSDVIDDHLRWSWGDGHLVIVGDVFDRGDQVTECLWLIHQLDWQARDAGGAVHMLLGNHETIAMRGDERYVHEKYLNGIVRSSFGGEDSRYWRIFGPETELGRWLRSKNAAVVIDSILFVHGGISPEAMHRGFSLYEINAAAREGIEFLRGDTTMPEVPEFVHGSLGPMWYRGWQYGLEERYPAASTEQVDSTLAYYGATTAVCGHSELDSVTAMHDGRVYFIDVPVDEIHGFEGLLIEDGAFYRVKPDGARIRLN